MGCGSSQQVREFNYSVEVSPAQPGETEVRRHPRCANGIPEIPEPNIKTLKDMILNTLSKFPNRPYLGVQKDGIYEFKTYQQVYDQADQLGKGIVSLKLAPPINEYKNYTLRLVGIFARNRPEWMVLDWANILYGATMIPFYDTLGAESIPFILDQTNLITIFCAAQPLKTLLTLKKEELGKLQNIVLLDPIPQEDEAKINQLGLQIWKYEQVLEAGQKTEVQQAEVKPSDIFTFSYTSGTTGNPKGAMLTHANVVCVYVAIQYLTLSFSENDVHLSYLPLPHAFERLVYLIVTYHGGSIGFFRGDPLLLKEDIAILRPTFFPSVPRLFNKMYDGIKAKIANLTGMKKNFAEKAIQVKLENLRTRAEYTHFLYDKAFEGVRQLFGGRCRFMLTGSAPISREVIDFLKISAGCPIYEGYGQTESCAASFFAEMWDPNSGHVGGPSAITEFKLQDVPEMSYTSLDKDSDGRPCPRGEVCIRGPSVFAGYYKDEEKTKEAIDDQGWLHTGDVGMLLRGGNIKIIDRKKNIFKLSQGEYIAPEKIENIYLRAQGVAEVFVYGDSLQNNCVSIVVPQKDYIEAYARENGIEGSFEELCLNAAIRKHMLENLTTQGKSQKLNSLENVKAVYLEPQSFQVHGCFTTTFKLQRHQAKLKFQTQIDEMYASMN